MKGEQTTFTTWLRSCARREDKQTIVCSFPRKFRSVSEASSAHQSRASRGRRWWGRERSGLHMNKYIYAMKNASASRRAVGGETARTTNGTKVSWMHAGAFDIIYMFVYLPNDYQRVLVGFEKLRSAPTNICMHDNEPSRWQMSIQHWSILTWLTIFFFWMTSSSCNAAGTHSIIIQWGLFFIYVNQSSTQRWVTVTATEKLNCPLNLDIHHSYEYIVRILHVSSIVPFVVWEGVRVREFRTRGQDARIDL